MYSLRTTNIVILAQNHNPSIATKDWLINNEIIDKNENIRHFVHTPAFSVIETDIFSLTIDPDRFQISLKRLDNESIKYLLKIVKGYISNLPETPYKALGINYLYNVSMDKKKLKELFVGQDKLYKELFGDDYSIGGIIGFKYDKFIVKLQLKQTNDESIADFNYHLNSKEEKELITGVDKYFGLKKQSEIILEAIS